MKHRKPPVGSTPLLLVILLSFLLLFLIPQAFGADWPNFRNDVSNAGASAENINLPLVEQWHSTAPDIEENGVVVANGIAYMITDDGFLHAFNVATGFNVAGFPVPVPRSYSTPAVDTANDRIYVLVASTLYAFQLDGNTAWTRAVGSLGVNYSMGPIVDVVGSRWKHPQSLFDIAQAQNKPDLFHDRLRN